ncbi:MAG: endonuclease III [Nitrospirales bacterium]
MTNVFPTVKPRRSRRAASPRVRASRQEPQLASPRARVRRMLAKLEQASPTPRVEMTFSSPLELLIATILSAQCTDQRVNQVTPALFRRYRTAADYAGARPSALEAIIRSTGFFKSKARHIIGCTKALVERFGGAVPRTMEELVTLPGVGRKTANVVLGACFGLPALVVDTHVTRVANRLGLTTTQDPDAIERDLQRALPEERWTDGSQRLLLHGRYVCMARAPKCDQCVLYTECRWEGKRPR